MNALPTDASRVSRSPRIASRVLEGQAVIVVGDARRLYTLNGVGTEVFELADGRSVGEIVEEVRVRYAVDADVVRSDVHAFVRSLVDAGALVVTG